MEEQKRIKAIERIIKGFIPTPDRYRITEKLTGELAKALDKAIGVDENKLYELILPIHCVERTKRNSYWFSSRKLSKAISNNKEVITIREGS